MKISTVGYSTKQGFKNIARNKLFSIASIATMAACIFVFGLFFAIVMNFNYIVQKAEEGVAITVFFDEGLDQSRIDEIGDELRSCDGVLDVEYVSADDAWESFQSEYFGEDSSLAEGFKDDNPLANSDNYAVYMEDAIIAILLAVSIFLISNTVTMGITVRREEIAIMKYIGAKDGFVRAPFVIEGVVIGLIGAIIPLALLYFMYGKAVSYILQRFNLLNNILDFLPVTAVYKVLLPVGLALGVGIGFVGSFFTIRKHLKV